MPQKSGCGLLLDVNNVMVSAVNHRLDPVAYVDRFPVELVGEIHLAGYDETTDGAGDRLLIDAHGTTVKSDVLELYRHTLSRTGPVATLIEWDNDVPAFDVLLGEATKAERMLADEASRRNRARRRQPERHATGRLPSSNSRRHCSSRARRRPASPPRAARPTRRALRSTATMSSQASARRWSKGSR